MLSLIRWILVFPAAVGAWYVALFLAMALLTGLDHLCPREQIVSGMCMAPWYPGAFEVLFCFGAGIAAALVVVTCTLIAPSYKRRIAVATFLAGSVVAVVMGFTTHAYAALITSIVAGAIVLCVILMRHFPRTLADKSI